MKVGEIIIVIADVCDPQTMTAKQQLRRATVIYIHPDFRYYTVEYENGIRESFRPEISQLDEKPRSGFHTKKKK